jgi:hypothetical protein
MKTMTCRQLGGPCELALRGDSADQVIKAQDRHLKEAVQNGDPRSRWTGTWPPGRPSLNCLKTDPNDSRTARRAALHFRSSLPTRANSGCWSQLRC